MAAGSHRTSSAASRATPSASRRGGSAIDAPKLFLAAGLGFLAFILYGSLVPFDFRPGSFEGAWQSFQRTPWLTLGIESRADWVANILLYVPFGFCFTAALDGKRGRFRAASVVAGVLVFLFGAVVAVGVEFTQLFFPPRTVSLNDIAAELLGTATGIALWWAAGERASRLLASLAFGGPFAIRAAVSVYVLGYLALSLFPFDFVLNPAELQEKLRLGLYDPLFVRGTCDGLFMCAAKLGAEAAAAAPLGLLLGLMMGSTARPYLKAFLAGCALGTVVEVGQFFIASGVSQGISIVTRGLGFAAGIAVQRAASRERLEASRAYLRPFVRAAVVPYLVALAALHGWFAAPWTDVTAALASLEEVRFLPFYYHYFTTESVALQSLLRVAAAYLPVGIGYCLWCAGARRATAGSGWIPALLAAGIAAIIETGRLFVPGRRPDPTDVLIAAFSSYAAFAVTAAVLRWTLEGPGAPAPAAPVRRGARERQVEATSRLAFVGSFVLLVMVGALLVLHPFGGRAAAVLGAYALVLWRWPWAALPATLAFLPVLNFAPWTGWVLFDEFDLLAGVTVALWLLRREDAAGLTLPHRRAAWIIGLLAVSYAVSAVAGLLPFGTFDQSALAGYYGSLNSLRVAKGFLWPLLLLPILNREMRAGTLDRRVAAGVLLGLAGVVAVTLWQRAAMSGLLDFSTDYRIAATFPETHIGGGDVEAYLAMALPFALAWIALRPSAARAALGTALFALGSYALAVTFARAGYIAYGGMVATGVAALVLWLLRRRSRAAGLALACGLAVTATVVMAPIVTSSFMQSRFSATQADGAFRMRHWREAADMMDPGVGTMLFGMGLGSYPRTYLLKNPAGAVPATFNYLQEDGNRFVRLGSGEPLYLDQRVAALPGEAYTLSLDLRSRDANAAVSASLCEKTEQHAFECRRLGFSVKAPDGTWSREALAFNSGPVGAGPRLLHRPVVVSLANSQAATRVDVDNVSLRDSAGRELLSNGDFSRSGAHWFFTTDNHAQWHVFNLWTHVYFEQGLLGVLALALAVAAAVARLAAGMWRGDLFSAALLAALGAGLIIGLFNSLLDSPRVAAFFFLLLFVALTRPRPDPAPGLDTRHAARKPA